ncbi:MAG: hypothetical protein JRI25_01650 [Deltaproteobacteria bacterium]|nr:hypothetical protein [Deltaproteobacteria bacterium]MBW2253284.1 hypothetical protein [Deltaproteobacteria bacterium]
MIKLRLPLGTWARRLARNPGYKVLSFSIALVAWLYVQGEQVVEAKVRARAMWTLPPDLLAVEPLPASVVLTVAGRRNAIRRAAQGDVRVPIDLSDIGIGGHTVDFSAFPAEGVPANLEVLEVAPASIRFSLDEVLAKKVRIEPKLVGDPEDGYQVAEVAIYPQVVSIRGPRVNVDTVSEIATLPIDVSGFATDVAQRVELDLPRSVALVSDEVIRVVIDIDPRVVDREFTAAPVDVWRLSGWTCTPETVTVVLEGPAAAMAEIAEEDVVVFAHLPDPPDRSEYEAPFGPTEGTRLRVLHGGGDEVRAVSVEPSVVRVAVP